MFVIIKTQRLDTYPNLVLTCISKDMKVLEKHIEVKFMSIENGQSGEIFEEKRKLDGRMGCMLLIA